MIKNIISKLLNKKAPTEWRSEGSIYELIRSNIDENGKLKINAFELPDEVIEENKLRYVSGLRDALFATGQTKESERLADTLAIHLHKVALHGDKFSESKFYDLIAEEDDIVNVIDCLLEKISTNRLPIEPHLFGFAWDLAAKSKNRNAVKIGIAVLGLCKRESASELLETIGLHDEFTLFASVAICSNSENPVQSIFKIAQKVDGWGRIQIVERLVRLPLSDEIKNWLVMDGYRNSIMNEYLAYTCAVHGELHEKIRRETITEDLFQSTSEIIDSLICGGPAEDISDFDESLSLVKNYLRHADRWANAISQYITISRIYDFLSELDIDSPVNQKMGWTEEYVIGCKKEAMSILENPKWKQVTIDALNGNDSIEYFSAKIAAKKFGIELWGITWAKLKADPTNSSLWFDVTSCAMSENAHEIVDFAIKNINLSELSTGPKDSLGMGEAWQIFQCLESATTFLKDYPGFGVPLIIASLRAPAIRNRNVALDSLKSWGHKHWTQEIFDEISALSAIEPNDKIKEKIQEMLGLATATKNDSQTLSTHGKKPYPT